MVEVATILILVWPFVVGAAVELTKTVADRLPAPVAECADTWLPVLAFVYGAALGALFAPMLTTAVVQLLELPDDTAEAIERFADQMPTRLTIAWAAAGLGAGAVASTVYRAIKSRAPEAARKLFDWWK